jgi:prepilin-type N-terminal cleavage/methylation domain-containing protein
MSSRAGFTLLEFSIVLVIIGLIAGGVLVGRDLIDAARVRQQITQIEKFNTAANTFRTKYGFLPGDLPETEAASLEFHPRSSVKGDGDGNGYIGFLGSSTTPQISGEAMLFWTDLTSAGLIEDAFTAYNSAVTPFTSINKRDVPKYLPAAAAGTSDSYVTVYHLSDWSSPTTPTLQNNYQILKPYASSSIGIAISGATGAGSALTPMQAQAIDQKTDDGLPATGRVQVSISTDAGGQLNYTLSRAIANSVGSPWTDCANIAVTPPLYSTADALQANKTLCSLRIRAGF